MSPAPLAAKAASSGTEPAGAVPGPAELVFLHRLTSDLVAAGNVEEASATLLRRVREATGAETAALLSVHHGRLRCRLEALDPPGAVVARERELRLDAPPVPELLGQHGPTVLDPRSPRLPWLPARGDATQLVSAPLRRQQQKVSGLLVVELPVGREVAGALPLVGIAAQAALLGLDAVRREAREEFLAMVRHDIFNPITVALFHTEMLAESLQSRDDKELTDLAQSVHSCLSAVCDMVSNFFYLDAIDQGAPAIHPEPIDFVELVSDIVDAHRPSAAAKRLELTFEGSCPEMRADRRQLGRVVTNLVGNALKYTPGPGRIEVRLAPEGEAAVLTVRDTGAGLGPDDLARLFTKHARFHRHLDVPGTGLGLYLSKAIVEAHGGRIDVTSQVGRGSTFVVHLPLV